MPTLEAKHTPLIASSDILEGEITKIKSQGGKSIAVCRVNGVVYAFDDMCSHGASSLSDEGELEGFNVVCGWHAGAFDVRSGAAVAAPCTKAIKTYKVTETDKQILIVLDEDA